MADPITVMYFKTSDDQSIAAAIAADNVSSVLGSPTGKYLYFKQIMADILLKRI